MLRPTFRVGRPGLAAAFVPAVSFGQLALSPASQTLVAPGSGSLTLTLPAPAAALAIVNVTISDGRAVLVNPFWFNAGETTSTTPVLTFQGGDPVTVTAAFGGDQAAAIVHVLNPAPEITRVFPSAQEIGVYQPYLQVADASWSGCPRTLFPSCVVYRNGVPLDTLYAHGDTGLPDFLMARIRPTDVLRPGTASITVVNPPPGGGTSAPVTVDIVGAAVAVPALSGAAAALLGLALGIAGFAALLRS